MSSRYDDFLNLSCDTKIRSEQDGYYVFENTVFYGEKGGQLSDQGTINGLNVLDLKWEGDTLLHKVDGVLQDPIHMEVDFKTRVINTTVQSAYHILDGYYAKKGLYILSIGVNEGNHWYEVNSKDITEEDLEEVQEFMNRVVMQDIQTEFTYMKGSDYENPKYHKYDELRIVRIGDLDIQPCGTPHVKHTYEIGNFIILGSEKTARGTKVFTTCSLDANQRMKRSYEMLGDLKRVMSASEEELIPSVTAMIANNKALKKELNTLRNEFAQIKAQELLQKEDKMIVCEGMKADLLRQVSQILLKHAKHDMFLVVEEGEVLEFTFISLDNQARNVLEKIKENYSVQGGGSLQMISAKVTANMSSFKDFIERII